ncbi:hypothetical protein ENUP19_0047G0027 [Entamoeba nuttalli]|uniref:phospholipase A2 n=1 Tax=Entamoeba nuttalli TaxID=412467 RepID=A0ABQ0DAU0_9EUKA
MSIMDDSSNIHEYITLIENGRGDEVIKKLETQNNNWVGRSSRGLRLLFSSCKNKKKHIHSHYSCLQLVKYIIEKFPHRLNYQDIYGKSCIYVAIQNQQWNIIEYLINKSVNYRLADKKGNTVLHYLCEIGINKRNKEVYEKFINQMLKDKDVINAQNELGETALHIGCLNSNSFVVNRLLDNNANVTLKTIKGLTPWDYAIMSDEICVERKRLDPSTNIRITTTKGSKKSKSSKGYRKSSKMTGISSQLCIEALDEYQRSISFISKKRRNSVSSCSSITSSLKRLDDIDVKTEEVIQRSSSAERKSSDKKESIFSFIIDFIEKKIESDSDSENDEKEKKGKKIDKKKKISNPILFESNEERITRYGIIADELMKQIVYSKKLEKKEYHSGEKFRVLSLDGGGVKCIYQCVLLKRIIKEIPDFFDKIDLVTGLSASSLVSVSILLGLDMEFVIKVMEAVSLETFKNESHLAGIAGHQFTNKFLKVMGERLLGNLTINDLPRNCCIQSFLIDTGKDDTKRTSKAMLYNNFMKETYDKDLKNICLQSAAAPGYFDPLNNHVDGSLLVNNPFYLTYPLIIGENGLNIAKENIVALSIGSGYPTVPYYDIEQMGNAGLIQWLIKLSDFNIFARKEMGVAESRMMFKNNYFRLDPHLPIEVDIADAKNIEAIKVMGKEQNLDKVIEWIKNTW